MITEDRQADAGPIRKVSSSVVRRTTLLILFFAGLVGIMVAMGSTVLVAREERQRLQQNLVELMQTVERTASIAAFARDEQLASEVAQGLLRNRAVARVVIREGGRTLVEHGHDAEQRPNRVLPVLTRPLMSPFLQKEQVGELEVWPAIAKIEQDAGAYSRFIAIILALQLVSVVASVAWVVLNVVTRPVKKLSDELHHLRIGSGELIPLPAGHGHDEIGRLTGDINALIARMEGMLGAERELRAEREESERKFRLIFESAETGIFTLDSSGQLHDWNPWMARRLGLAPDGRSGPRSLRDILGEQASRLDALMVRVLADQRPAGADFALTRRGTGTLWLQLVLNPLPGNLMQGIVNDVTEQKQAEAHAIAMAERDALTGLLNRRGIEHRLGDALRALDGQGLALMLLDLDGFKQVNDTLGHEAGDRVLATVARQLESVVRRTDLVARPGGDEFVVVLQSLETVDTARFIAAKIVSTLSRPIDLGDGQRAQIGASIGIAYTESRQDSGDALMRRADEAMYEAKRAGKSQYRFAS